MSNVMTRLQRLEARAALRDKEPTEDDFQRQGLWEHLVASMDPNHLHLLTESANRDWSESFDSPGFRLLDEISSLLFTQNSPRRRLV